MRSVVRDMGNGWGVIIPRPILDAVGAKPGDPVEIAHYDNRIVIVPMPRTARAGWTEDAKAIAAAWDEGLVWPEFANKADADLTW